MMVQEQIKSDLARYFQENNITDVEQGITDLQALLTPNVLNANGIAKDSPRGVQAWTALQIQQGSTFRYRRYKDIVYIGSTDINNLSVVETKRFLYNTLSNTLKTKRGCFSVLGTRHVGKTTLLLQLYKSDPEFIDYLDCSTINSETFNLQNYYSHALYLGKKVILLDEVCKIGHELYADFVMLTKCFSDRICFIITGSVYTLVEKLCADISRGVDYILPPFMYIERLCWKNDIEINNIKKCLEYVTDETFKEYLKNQFMSNNELMSYMKGIVHDTLTSFRSRTHLEGDLKIDDIKLLNCLKYISLCQLIYITQGKNKKYVDIPAIPSDIREKIFSGDYSSARRKWDLTTEDINTVLRILYGSHLIKKIVLKGDIETIDKDVPAFIFEYPWYVSFCLNPSIQGVDTLMDLWIEYALVLRASYIYYLVVKYRSEDKDEIDILYELNGWNGLEVKNRPNANITNAYRRSIQVLAESLNISSLYISSEETNSRLAASLELEYIDIIENGQIESNLTIEEIINKFSGGKEEA